MNEDRLPLDDVKPFPTDIRLLVEEIAKRFPYNAQNYPELASASGRKIREFGVEHSIFHLVKSLGIVAGQSEAADHGRPLDEVALGTAAAKLVGNALQLCNVLGMSAEQMLAIMEHAMHAPPKK